MHSVVYIPLCGHLSVRLSVPSFDSCCGVRACVCVCVKQIGTTCSFVQGKIFSCLLSPTFPGIILLPPVCQSTGRPCQCCMNFYCIHICFFSFYSFVDAARIIYDRVYVTVWCPSVCLSHLSTAPAILLQQCAAGLLACR